MLSEISQAEKDNYPMVSLMWNIRNSREIGSRRKGRMKEGVNRRGNEPQETMDPG